MFKHMLIATDGSDLAAKAVTTGLGLAKSLGAMVTVVTVTEPRTNLVPDKAAISSPADDYEAALAAAAKTVLANASAAADKLGVSCGSVHLHNEFPAEGILKEAKPEDATPLSWHRTDEEALRDCSSAVRPGGSSIVAIPVLVCR